MTVAPTYQTPVIISRFIRVPAVAAGSDADSAAMRAPFAGNVVAVTYTPDTVLTGVVTNSRTLSLRNKAQDGTGTTVVASVAYVNGVNIAAMDEGTVTLSVVANATDVAEGDILGWQSLHVGTGLADPGGLLRVDISRA